MARVSFVDDISVKETKKPAAREPKSETTKQPVAAKKEAK